MAANWIKVYTTSDFFKAELVKQVLIENEMEAILMNKKDSSYQFGEIQILVPELQFAQAIELITQNNL
ncbi:MAG: putative signal transducing protein [Sphingobacteriaceae bacterium]